MLVLDRQPAHRREAREDQRMHGCLRAAREHGIGVAALDQLCALADRVRSGRAGGDDRVVRALDAQGDRELPARRVDEDVREEVRRDAVGAALAAHLLLVEDPVDAADRGTEDDPHAHRVEAVERGVRHRLSRRAQREDDVALELPDLLRRSHLRRVEVLDLGCDPDRNVAGIERADPVDSALPGQRSPPRGGRVVADRRDGAEAGDGYSPHRVSLDR
jgi:hypothetical protein